jgi:probable F420-dependent oxidoreductase
MRVGVMVHATDRTDLPAVAVAAEERGFDSLFVTEHTHIPVQAFIPWRNGEPMPEDYKRLHDPIVALATCAAVTSRLRIGTGVLVIGQREPLALAKQLASLDRLSGGRLVVGTGYGWLRSELANHSIAWGHRRSVWAEHVGAVSALWRDEEAAFDGEHVRFDPVWSFPKPLQRPRPPVLLGATGSDATLHDVVHVADGWMPIEGVDDIARCWQRLRSVASEMGRPDIDLQLVVYASAGDPRTLDGYVELGASTVVVGLGGDDPIAQLDRFQPLVERYHGGVR